MKKQDNLIEFKKRLEIIERRLNSLEKEKNKEKSPDNLYKEYEKKINSLFEKKLKQTKKYLKILEELKKESPDLINDLENLHKLIDKL